MKKFDNFVQGLFPTPASLQQIILFEDAHVLVIHKPAGIAVQSAGFGSMDLESAIKNYLAAKNPGKMPYLGLIHRLDQPVEGALVFAKTPAAARELSRQMTAGELGKHYLAVTAQKPVNSETGGTTIEQKPANSEAGEKNIAQPAKKQNSSSYGELSKKQAASTELKKDVILEDYLLKDARKNMSQVVRKGTQGAKLARLSYIIEAEADDPRTATGRKYLLRIKLDTGRHHQIRVQMSHAAMPLLGDRKYAPEEKSGYPLALCSCQLEFRHPVTKKKMTYTVKPQGEAFQGAWK